MDANSILPNESKIKYFEIPKKKYEGSNPCPTYSSLSSGRFLKGWVAGSNWSPSAQKCAWVQTPQSALLCCELFNLQNFYRWVAGSKWSPSALQRSRLFMYLVITIFLNTLLGYIYIFLDMLLGFFWIERKKNIHCNK